MASKTASVDVSSLLQSLNFGSTELDEAREAVRTDREAHDAAREAVRSVASDAKGADAVRRALALYLLARPEEAREALENADERSQATLLQGRVALETGDPSAAANAFASLVNSPLDGPTLLLDLATSAALSGDTAMAERAAGKLDDGADGLYAEGLALESDGEYAEARKKYEAALKEDPNHARALFRLALRVDTEGEDDRAIELYRRLVNLQPTYVNALINLALLYEDQARFTEAEQCYRRVLTADPQHVRARIGLKDVVASQSMFFDEDHERREDRRAQVLRTAISEFELSVRSRNCLAKMDIETLGDLVRKTESELLAYKNFGETSLQEIKDILAQKGLRLGMSTEDDAPLYSTSRAEAEAQLDALFGSLGGDASAGGSGGEPALMGSAPSGDGGAHAPGQDPRSIPIESLDLSIRARRCMDNLDIQTVGDLIERSEAELLAAKNFGQTSLNEVRRKLSDLGLSLKKK